MHLNTATQEIAFKCFTLISCSQFRQVPEAKEISRRGTVELRNKHARLRNLSLQTALFPVL